MDDDDQPTQQAQKPRRRVTGNGGSNPVENTAEENTGGDGSDFAMGPIYTMWESSLEKLKILNYEGDYCRKWNQKPLNRVHFAIPASNPSQQFDDFMSLCTWLITIITSDPKLFKTDALDDPNTRVNKLILALRQLEYRSPFSAQKLRAAHGEPVCVVLEFLVDKALTQRGFKWESPVYTNVDEIEQAQTDDPEEDDIIEDNIEGVNDEDVVYEDLSRLETSLDNSTQQIILPQIDPIEWKTELERVAPKLKATTNTGANEWRAHVDQTMRGKESVEKIMTHSKNELQALNKVITDELSQMKIKEKYLNNQHNTICLEYTDVKHKLEALEQKGSATNEVVAKLTNELAEISEKLDDLKESFDSKDSGLHDTSPLLKIKAALQQIKKEIHQYDMRIGVVSQTLLIARVGDHTRQRMKALNTTRRRHQKGAQGKRDSGANDHDDQSILSDGNE